MLITDAKLCLGAALVDSVYLGTNKVYSSTVAPLLEVMATYGTNNHLWLAGDGVLNGVTAGNYLDSEGTTPAVDNGLVGRVKDTVTSGNLDASQTTTANKPTLRLVNGAYRWVFNDISTCLLMPSAVFQMTDDHCVVAVASCAFGLANTVVVCPAGSSSASSINRLGMISYDGADSSIHASWYDGTNYDNLSFAWPLNTPFVAAARKVGTTLTLWVNGVLRATQTATVSGFSASAGSIGAYPNTAAGGNFNGDVYSVLAIKGTVSDADRITLERGLNALSGYPVGVF